MKFVCFILIPLLTAASCRFGKPLISKPGDHLVITDSLGVTTDSKYFTYLNFHRYISIGGGGVQKLYNKNGKLISKEVFKATKGGMKDGNNRYYHKTKWFDSCGKVDSIHKYIQQNYGRTGRIVKNKTKVK